MIKVEGEKVFSGRIAKDGSINNKELKKYVGRYIYIVILGETP